MPNEEILNAPDGLAGREARRESEAGYRALFDNARDALIIREPASGAFMGCNPAALEMFKVKTGAEFLALTSADLSPEFQPDGRRSPDKDRELTAAAANSGRVFFEWTHKRAGGEAFPAEVLLTRTVLDGQTLLLACVRDITRHRRTEVELRDRESKIRALFDQTFQFIGLMTTDGTLIEANRTALEFSGIGAERVLNKPFWQGPWWEHSPELQENLRQAVKTAAGGELVQFEASHLDKDGTLHYIDFSLKPVKDETGRTVFLIPEGRDITERKKAERDLRQAYEMQGLLNTILRRSLTSVPLHKKLTDHLAALLAVPWLAVEPKGAVFLLNGRTLTLTAQQGLPPALLAACDKLPLGKCLCGMAALSGKVVTAAGIGHEHEIVYEGIPPHGHYCVPIIAAGATLGVLNLYLKEGTTLTARQKDFIQAVTDIIASDILRAQVEEQFSHSQKMEAIGHMAGGVTHDFNNIITAIMGYADFLRAAIPPEDPKYADVQEIIRAGHRASVLTQQLLAFSRKQLVQFRVLNLDQIISEVIKMVRRIIERNIEFRTAFNSAPASVLANQGQLEQAITNLALNARDAMPNGGTLAFETERIELDENYSAGHPGVSPGTYVLLTVSDTGHGMPPEVMSHLFEPFFTTKEPGKGTGLGLSTVYGIVRQSGGSISVLSEPGKGTAFRIYLPLAAEKAEAKPADKQPSPSYSGTETILLVEDEEPVLKFIGRVLAQNGYSVLKAASPQEALALCERRTDISLLITDIVMPQMNGYDLARAITARAPGMKTIFMSGYIAHTPEQKNAAQSGMIFMEKPLEVEVILRKVRQALEARKL